MKNRIRNLLINGLTASEICTIVSCSPSYVSQLLKEEEFRKEVEAGKIAAQEQRSEEDHIDTRYQNVEHKILTSIEGSLEEASLGEKVRALEMIQKRQDSKFMRKNPAPEAGTSITMNVVSLQLPNQAARQQLPLVQMNSDSEIVAIDGKVLAPMSSDGVKSLFQRIGEAKQSAQQLLSEF